MTPIGPPPATKRLPVAKSAPATSAATNAGISLGSAVPSASKVTMMSPVAAAKPQANAFPLPERVWVTTFAVGSARRAISTDPSVEPPSVTITSATGGRIAAIAGNNASRLLASLRAGTTTETRGLPLRAISPLPNRRMCAVAPLC